MPNGWKKTVKKMMSAASSGLIAGPILVPAYDAVYYSYFQAGGATGANPVNEFVYSATGYDMSTNTLSNIKLKQVITRDAFLVSAGLIGRWISKKV